jgi:hypothetical protein
MYPYKPKRINKTYSKKADSKLCNEIANLKNAVAKNNAKFNAQKMLNEISKGAPSRVR